MKIISRAHQPKGKHLINCKMHGGMVVAADACPKCLKTLIVERDQLRALLVDKAPEFIQALVVRNRELYNCLVQISKMKLSFEFTEKVAFDEITRLVTHTLNVAAKDPALVGESK